ncbi:MAG: FtsX-like permease family protein [Planctomycetota bacterium]
MLFDLFVGTRFFRRRLINYLAILMVAFAVMMPIVVLAVMQGFANYMAEQIRGALSDMVVGSVTLDSLVPDPGAEADRLAALPLVAGATPFIRNFVVVKGPGRGEGIVEPALLQGIDPVREAELLARRGPRADLATAIFGQAPDPAADGLRALLAEAEINTWDVHLIDSRVRDGELDAGAALDALAVLVAERGGAAAAQKLADLRAGPGLDWEDVLSTNDALRSQFVDICGLTPTQLFHSYDGAERFEETVYPEALVNGDLATALGITPGGTFTVASVTREGRPVKRKYRMAAALRPYSAAKGDRFDMPAVVVAFDEACVLFGTEGNATGISIWLKDGTALAAGAAQVAAATSLPVITWREMRANVLAAVANENRLLQVVLLCIIVAAGFGILAIIYTSVSEKVRDIGIMKAVGIRPAALVRIFMFKTLWIGAIGTVAGVGLAWLVVHNINFLSKLIGWTPFSSEIYYLPLNQQLPVSWEDAGVPLFAAAGLLISLAAGLYPALRAATLNAVDAIRNA